MRIPVQIRKIDLLSLLFHFGMLSTKQPADVSKEKAPVGIMRICVSLGILVMNPVISGPLDDVVLQGGGLEEDEGEAALKDRWDQRRCDPAVTPKPPIKYSRYVHNK